MRSVAGNLRRSRRARRIGLTAALLLLGGVGLVAIAGGAGSNAASPRLSSASADPGATGASADESRLLPCTPADEPANFETFSLGPDFSGLPMTAALRVCEKLHAGDKVRANYVSYIYGSCEIAPPAGGKYVDGGCQPPLEVQSWPSCERSLADYTLEGLPYPRESAGHVGQAPAFLFDGGSRLEMYSGETTIVIFGLSEKTVEGAAEAVRAEPEDAPAVETAGKLSTSSPTPLAAPAPGSLGGELQCR